MPVLPFGGITPQPQQRFLREILRLRRIADHAIGDAMKLAEEAQGEPPILLVNLSGRGDKDMAQAIKLLKKDAE